ncbi:hypothetical protein ACJVC5_17260 [Peredibacter sp. HCB2-198]|uniref:hypothetical protein n=1 Tax=Peredibacter sp. HCB2-198 TaxID=3383025 RepID=UPI0038B683E1
MNFLVFLALIPFAFADSPPTCQELGRYIQGYEKDLQKKFVRSPGTECRSLKLEDLGSNIPLKNTQLIEENKCSSLSVIEAQLETLKNQEAILTGIDKLKNTIKDSKTGTGDKNQAVARTAGNTFVNNLNTAQSLELLLSSHTKEGTPFLAELKKIPQDKRNNPTDFKNAVKELCKNKQEANVIDACVDPKLFAPNQDAVKEINGLISQAEPNATQIQKWQKMLSIKRKNVAPEESAYSFTQMQMEMNAGFDKLDKNQKLSRPELKVIQNLNEFENADGLSFVEDLGLAKDQFKSQFASDRFRFLLEDARRRQQYEIQSKISIAWADLDKSKIKFEQLDLNDCNLAKDSYEKALSCHFVLENKIKDQLTGDAKAHISGLLGPLGVSIKYENKLANVGDSCLDEVKTKGILTEGCLKELNAEKADVQDKILQLNLLKERIGFENKDLMAYRNFALLKWGTQKCDVADSLIEFCDPEDKISREANFLSNAMMDISLVYTPKSEAETEVQKLCEDESEKKKKAEERLCAFFNDTTSNIVKTDNHKKEDVDGPVTAPDGGNAAAKERDAWIQGGTQILNELLRSYNPNRGVLPTTSPYPYNYGPYNGGRGPMGIADTIMFNARYYGAYGYYMPTPGYTPYTAFSSTPSSLGSYTALKASSYPTYFGK